MFKELLWKWIKDIHKKIEGMEQGVFDAEDWELLVKKEQEFESDLVKLMAKKQIQEVTQAAMPKELVMGGGKPPKDDLGGL